MDLYETSYVVNFVRKTSKLCSAEILRQNKIFCEKQKKLHKQKLDENRCKQIHKIIVNTETKYFKQKFEEETRINLIKYYKNSRLSSNWEDIDKEERAREYRKKLCYYHYSESEYDKWYKVVEAEIDSLNNEQIWNLYKFFQDNEEQASRSKEYFKDLKIFKSNDYCHSNKLERNILCYLADDPDLRKADVRYGFLNIAIQLRKKILENQEYYIKNTPNDIIKKLEKNILTIPQCILDGIIEYSEEK